MAPEAKPLDSGHLYSPSSSYKAGVNEDRCRAAVHDEGRWPGFHQCHFKPSVTRKVLYKGEVVEVEYCKIHDPVKVAEKDAARQAKWKKDWGKTKRDGERNRLRFGAVEALRKIAGGHNDPRSLAQDFLDQYDALGDQK